MRHELRPEGRGLGVLVNPDNPSSASELQDAQTAAHELAQTLTVFDARGRSDIDTAFAAFVQHQVDMLYLVDDPLFNGLRKEIAALAIRHSIGAVSALREFVEAGFLASFGPSFTEVHRQCGLYVGRILKGESPGDLPVMLPTRFSLVLNVRTAEALRIALPPMLLARADELIE